MESDLLTVMQAVTNGTLAETEVKFSGKNACCVIMASEGYPEKYEKGFEISIPGDIIESVYVAGAKTEDGRLLDAGADAEIFVINNLDSEHVARSVDGFAEKLRNSHMHMFKSAVEYFK